MRRAPWVVGATGAGLGLLFSFHTKPVHVTIASPAKGSASTSPSSTTSTSSTTSPPTSGPATGATATTRPTATTSPPTTATPTRSGTGQDVQYQYGDLQLKVTERGSTITNIEILADGAADARSAEINSQALPMLQEEAMQAQSANIDGVSGATFTSNAYAQALQSALDNVS